jgi:hypothetical protein
MARFRQNGWLDHFVSQGTARKLGDARIEGRYHSPGVTENYTFCEGALGE